MMLNLIMAVIAAVFTAVPMDKAILCADQKVPRILLMDAQKDWSRESAILWQWLPDQDKSIKKEHRKWFRNISECKPVQGGKAVLVAASGGGVALVDMASCKAVFYAHAGNNPHSAALLPDGTIAAVCSTGNTIALFFRPEKFTDAGDVAKKTYEFHDAHGCVWDNKQQLLWVWGSQFAAYRYNGNRKNPALSLVQKYHPGHGILPETAPGMPNIPRKDPEFAMGGHDLFPVPGKNELFMSSVYGVMIFNTVTHQFRLFSDIRHVKSISGNPATGEVLYLVPAEEWWTDTVQTMDGKKFRLPGAKFYKVRWFSANTFLSAE